MKRTKPIDFNASNPPRAVTDPDRAEAEESGHAPNVEYPKHLVLPDLAGAGGPAARELVVATSASDEKKYRAQGYVTHHEADIVERKAKGDAAPKAAKPKAETKPRTPTPKEPKAPAAPVE